MPSLDFEVYCGICGNGICGDTDVNKNRVTVTCSHCDDEISYLKNEIERLNDEIDRLVDRLEKEER